MTMSHITHIHKQDNITTPYIKHDNITYDTTYMTKHDNITSLHTTSHKAKYENNIA